MARRIKKKLMICLKKFKIESKNYQSNMKNSRSRINWNKISTQLKFSFIIIESKNCKKIRLKLNKKLTKLRE